MTKYHVRTIRRNETIWMDGEFVADRRIGAPPHLGLGIVIERDGEIAGVLRGPTLMFWPADKPLASEICGGAHDAVLRLREVFGDTEKVSA
jgi:hypothetical protein